MAWWLSGRPSSPSCRRRTWRSELAEWRANHATAARLLEDLSALELASIDKEPRRLGERLSSLWEQRDTHQRWAAEPPEAWRRLDLLATEIDTLDASLNRSRLAHDRATVYRGALVVLDRGLGTDL
jgi:hypothetical protein